MEDNAPSTNQLLYDAALQGDVAALQSLLQRDPLLVYRSSTTLALHVACKLGHTQFVCELLRLNPSFSEELDPNDKSSPLHVATRNGHLELVRALVSINPSMCFARDMYGMNPVHLAAMKGHLLVLDELLRVIPPAAREVVGQAGGCGGGESILHLCVKYNQVEALRLVVSAVGDAEMLNATDVGGNTVMHVAVANKQLEIVRFLLTDRRIKKNAPNLKGLTSMDIFKQSHKDNINNEHQLMLMLKRSKMLLSEDIKKEKEKNRHFDWLENQRSALMVVASLIATMAFQAGITPPGGAWQDTTTTNTTSNQTGHTAGSPVMIQQSKRHYNYFIILNTAGLIASMSSILLLISGLPCRRFFVALIMVTMWVAIATMTAAYGVSLYALTPVEDRNLVYKVLKYSFLAWFGVAALLLLGHIILWTVRLLRCLGRLVKKLFRCCFPKRLI